MKCISGKKVSRWQLKRLGTSADDSKQWPVLEKLQLIIVINLRSVHTESRSGSAIERYYWWTPVKISTQLSVGLSCIWINTPTLSQSSTWRFFGHTVDTWRNTSSSSSSSLLTHGCMVNFELMMFLNSEAGCQFLVIIEDNFQHDFNEQLLEICAQLKRVKQIFKKILSCTSLCWYTQ